MPYRIRKQEVLTGALQRIAREQVDRALEDVRGSHDIEEAVHSARKRCKRIRALLRLVRDGLGDTYGDENAALRDAARLLAGLRDADVVMATHDGIVHHVTPIVASKPLDLVREALEERLAPRSADLPRKKRNELLETFASEIERVGKRVGGWKIKGTDRDVLRAGLTRTYRRARDARVVAFDTRKPESFHEWRKRVKYHTHHLRLLRDLADAGSPARRRRQLRQLADMLGGAHDLVVYQSWLDRAEAVGAVGQVVKVLNSLAFEHRIDNEGQALRLGSALFEAKPKRFSRQLVAMAISLV